MFKIIKFLLPLLFIFSTAEAEVCPETEKYLDNLLKYPVISLKKAGIAKNINKDIAKLVENLKKEHTSKKGTADKISMTYSLCSEDQQRLNLIVYSMCKYNASPRGQYKAYGFSYDLKTGDKYNSKQYLNALTPYDLDLGIRLGVYKLTNANDMDLQLSDFWKVQYVSQECLLNTDGSLTLIYQPNELAPYVYGCTFITIPSKDLEELLNK